MNTVQDLLHRGAGREQSGPEPVTPGSDSSFVYFLYSLLYSLGFLVLLPWLAYSVLRHGKYVEGFRQRLGDLPPLETGGSPVVWLHCVSVGEAQAARPLARAILDRFPSHRLVISTTTLTGQRLAREIFQEDATAVIYFPFDWAWTVRRALRRLHPSAVFIMETELWPRFLRECRRRGFPVAIVNGRLSEQSTRRYKIVSRFIRRVVNDLDLAVMQTDADAERLRGLGLSSERIAVSGNIKFDASPGPAERVLTSELQERFRFDGARPLIVAASTHAPEESIVLEAFAKLRSTLPLLAARLLIAPRHPERFAETASLLDRTDFAWTRRSSASSADDPDYDVVMLDTIGELRAVYPLAAVVFMGGSISRRGGHNVLEPAAAGVCTVTGGDTSNFASIVRSFVEAQALIQLPPVAAHEASAVLAKTLIELLQNGEERQVIGARALALIEQNRGATARTADLLSPLLISHAGSSGGRKLGGASQGALSA